MLMRHSPSVNSGDLAAIGSTPCGSYCDFIHSKVLLTDIIIKKYLKKSEIRHKRDCNIKR